MTGSALALWRPIPGKHYNGRIGRKVTHIDLHIMCGTLAGSDSWFRKPAVKACSHYGIGGTGTIYQWIDEVNGSWADANRDADCSGITIEHQGGLKNVACTDACIESSARLCADIASRYGWTRLWHDGLRGNVWLHREIPGTTHADCPDLAPNGLPYQRVIDRANQILQEEDMPSAQEIAEAIAQYHWGGDQSNRNIYDKLRYLEEGRTWDDDTHASPTGGLVVEQPVTYGEGDGKTTAKLGDRLAYIDQHTHAVDARLDAIEAKLDRLLAMK